MEIRKFCHCEIYMANRYINTQKAANDTLELNKKLNQYSHTLTPL